MTKKSTTSASQRNRLARKKKKTQRTLWQRLERLLLTLVFLLLAGAVIVTWLGGEDGQASRWIDDWQNRPQRVAAAAGRRVALIAGHKGHDSGAVCPDGLTEQETVERIAEESADRLRRAGAEVLVFAEYDERLQGLVADTLVSIHADSCIDRSGFKVARSATSVIPDVEDRLVACLIKAYQADTGLAFDSNSITPDMTGYHAFKRVAPQTPGAIIETGFLGADQELLTQRPDLPARGIANGILCFLQSSVGQ
jgi:N-acetylmuramoyl-L-alanine amidase